MTPQQLAILKANLIANGLLSPSGTDDQAIATATGLQQTNPDMLQKLMSTGPSWLMLVGVGAAGLAAYFLWNHFTKTKKLGEIERPEPTDHRRQLQGFSKSLSRFKGPSSTCKAPRRRRGLGDADYEFEPEIRLEGHRGSRRHGSRK